MTASLLSPLRERVQGQVVGRRDPGYDRARAVWNAMIDCRPLGVVRCGSKNDVVEAIRFARERDLPVAVRGGGHNIAGNGTLDDGLVIDLGPLSAVRVDPGRRRARVGGGATLKDVDRATQAHRLATPLGTVSTTGVGGLALGGGIGWLVRTYGLTCDQLVRAEVVTADGDVVVADEHEGSELLWGLRGGGGNFGIVTEFEFELHPLGPLVSAGAVLFPPDAWTDAFQRYRDWTHEQPDELNTMVYFFAPPPGWVDPPWRGRTLMAIAWCHAGPVEEGDRLAALLRALPGSIGLVRGPFAYLDWQASVDVLYPAGRSAYWKPAYFTDLSDAAIDMLAEHASRRPTLLSGIDLHHLGGAFGRVADEASAFSQRRSRFILNIYGVWEAAAHHERHIGWVRDFAAAVEPFASGGAYANFAVSTPGPKGSNAVYAPSKLARLTALKDRFDPDNVFRRNHNVAPSGWPAVADTAR